jgi:hypothetical protein
MHQPARSTFTIPHLREHDTMSAVTAFFIPKPTPTERKTAAKAKARETAKANLTKREKAAILAYQRADNATRKTMLRNQVDMAEQVRQDALRGQRRDYMRTWRMLRRIGTVLL